MRRVMCWLAALRRAPIEPDGPAARQVLRFLRRLGVIATLGMIVVLQQGTLVTNSGSAAGCGNTWPLCHGKIIPEFQGVEGAATLIEFTHRVAVPIETTLILILTAGLLWLWRGRREVRFLAPGMIVFLLLQAVLGGAAVMWPTSAPVLAAHFGISLIAFASVLLATIFVLEMGGAEPVRDRPVPAGLRVRIWGTLVLTYVVVYLGAYVRHTNSSLACIDWPLCNGAVVPPLVPGVTEQMIHRCGAAVLVLAIVWLVWDARRARQTRPDLYRMALASLALVLLQAVSGGIVVYARLAVLSTLLHSLLITLLFGTLCSMCYHILPRPAAVRQAAVPSPRVAPAQAHTARA